MLIVWIFVEGIELFSNSSIGLSSFMGFRFHSVAFIDLFLSTVYCVLFSSVIKIKSSDIIIKYGRNKFSSIEIKNSIILSIEISIAYCIIYCITPFIFYKMTEQEIKLHLLTTLFLLILIFFGLNLIGAIMYTVRNILNFFKYYFVVVIIILLFLAGIAKLTNAFVHPLSFTDDAMLVFTKGELNTVQYLIDIMKLVFSALVLFVIGKLSFLKKDIIVSE